MISDEQLVRQTVSGDVESFNRLVERYHGMVFNLAYRMLGDTSEAEDATQEAFLEGFKSVKGFQFQSTFKTWLYRVSINTCQQYIRKAESRQRILSSYTEGVAASQRVDSGPVRPDQHLLKSEREQIVQLAISDLPPKQRSVVTLFYMEHLHKNNFIHGKLNLENIRLDHDTNFAQLYLCNFENDGLIPSVKEI